MIYTLLWLLWLLAFLAIEIPAAVASYRGHPGGTLSEHIWAFIGIGQPLTWQVHLRRVAFLAFAAWLIVHLFFNGWV